MQLWGSTVDASKAELWKLPKPSFDEEADEDAADEEAEASDAPPFLPSMTEDAPAATKTYVKPTAHLPEDHKEAEGEAHDALPQPTALPPLGDMDEEYMHGMPTYKEGAPEPTSIGDSGDSGDGEEYYDEDSPGYLAGMSRLLKNSTWLFVAAGTVVVFVAGVSAFFLMRRRPGRGLGSRGGYEFAPGTDEEDGVAMRTRRTGSLRIGDGPRTRELYDAFALEGSDSEEGEGSDDGNGPKSRVRTDVAYTDEGVSFFSLFLLC